MIINDFKTFIPCWDTLRDEHKRIIADNIVIRTYTAGESIIINRTQKDGMIFVLDGNLRVYLASDNGREMTFFNIKSGGAFCIMTVDRAKEGDTVPCLQAAQKSIMAYIPREVLEPIALKVPELARFVFDLAADIAQAIINSNRYYFFNTLRGCVAKLIVDRCEPGKAEIKITHEEIANSLASTRVVISRELETLAEMGFIETHRGRIRIIDRNGLETFARKNR